MEIVVDALKDFDPGEFLRDPPMRPGSTQLDRGAGDDPALMIHDMRTAAREAAEAPRVDLPTDPPPEGLYDGAGGYRYAVHSDGVVTIVKAPGDRGIGTKLTRGLAYDAIIEELSGQTPDQVELEGGMALDTRRTESAEFDDLPGIDSPGAGVVSGEGLAGKEMARVEGLDSEEQVAELDRVERDRRGTEVKMSPAARLAFLRTKARNKARNRG
jgi:hypothetical protein